MKRKFRPARLAIVMIMFVGILTIYSVVLYKMQIYDPMRVNAEAASAPTSVKRYRETITAARGEILDRNGERLVSSRASYNISLSRSALLASGTPNDILQRILTLTAENGVTHNDTFPVSQGAPYEYTYDMSPQQRTTLDKYFEYFRLDPEISASDLIVWLKKHYDIPYTVGVAEARLIIGVRYELETREIVNLSPYIFAEDISLELVATVSELSLPGVSITTGCVRIYHTGFAAHLLGYTSKMDAKEMEYYTELGYPMDARIGKTGAEGAFEEYLHGVDGQRTIEVAENGAIYSETVTEAIPGNNVYLSIDIGLQEVAEKALADVIARINLDPERDESQKARAGAVVVTEVGTGQTLAMASYPTFDLSTMLKNYTELSNDPHSPLLNRATQGKYNPGSTFKPVTALAALRASTITRWTTITDQGRYTKYPDYQPRCWIYSTGATHGTIDLVEAIAHSCNYYFYSIGDNTGPSKIAEAAYDFGFGEKTGIEISEITGVVASIESRKEILNDIWHDADTLITAIGQGLNEFTPVQLANYTATIANGGTLYDMTMLRAVKSADYTATVLEKTPSVRSEIEEKEYITYLQEGMRAVASYGTARDSFKSYHVSVAAKTGTVQTSSDYNDGVFICYAPADNPEIAIAVVVEKGGSGAGIMEVASTIMDEYFRAQSSASAVSEGVLLP